MEAEALNAGVGRNGAGDASDASRPVEDVFGRLIVLTNFEMFADVSGRQRFIASCRLFRDNPFGDATAGEIDSRPTETLPEDF